MTDNIAGDGCQLTADEFQSWEEKLLRDVVALKRRKAHTALVDRCLSLALHNLNRARQLRTDEQLHAAELSLVDARLSVNEALAAAEQRVVHVRIPPVTSAMF
jgi:hypothetical protein